MTIKSPHDLEWIEGPPPSADKVPPHSRILAWIVYGYNQRYFRIEELILSSIHSSPVWFNYNGFIVEENEHIAWYAWIIQEN